MVENGVIRRGVKPAPITPAKEKKPEKEANDGVLRNTRRVRKPVSERK